MPTTVRAFLIFAMLMPATALMAATSDEAQCAAVNNKQTVELTIAACTRILDEGRGQHIDAIALRNRCGAYATNGNFAAALADCQRALAMEPGSATGHARRAAAYLGRGDLDRAIADYDEAIRLDPRFALVYRNRAGLYYEKKDYPRAIADYSKALEFDANDAVALYWRGKSRQMNGDRAGGDADIAAARKINPQVGN